MFQICNNSSLREKIEKKETKTIFYTRHFLVRFSWVSKFEKKYLAGSEIHTFVSFTRARARLFIPAVTVLGVSKILISFAFRQRTISHSECKRRFSNCRLYFENAAWSFCNWNNSSTVKDPFFKHRF